MSCPTTLVLIGSFEEALPKASFAIDCETPSTSNKIFPGFTRHAQNSGEPFPLPILTSVGFFDTGTSGNIRTQTRPALFINLVIATLAASICLAVILSASKALEAERITARQIEAARVAMTRFMKRAGRVWVRIFPDVPVSKKPTEVRMGKGKGSPEFWACRVKPGKILFEVDGVSQSIAKEAFGRASSKLPIKTKVVGQLIK